MAQSAARCLASAFRRSVPTRPSSMLRSGMGMPIGRHSPPTEPLPEEDELMWYDGGAYPELCLDDMAPMVGKWESLAWLTGGLSFFVFGLVGLLAVWNDKPSKMVLAPKEFPFDNLRVELGGKP